MSIRESHIIEVPAGYLGEGALVDAGGKTTCAATGAVLREGDLAVARLTQVPNTPRWGIAETFHPAAAPTDTIHGDESGDVVTLYVKGRLAVCSDAATQESTLRLVDAEAVSLLRPDDE